MHNYESAVKQKEILIQYLYVKIAQEDWHGVADAAMDIRELEAKCFWTSTTNTLRK